MDNESLWLICSFPRAVAEKGELGGRFELGEGRGACAGGAAVVELRLKPCGAGSLELLGHHHRAVASRELFHWDAPSLAGLGCSVLLTAASPSSLLSLYRQRLLLVLFQCFLLELFEVFWDVRSCKLIDGLGYQMRKQNHLLCHFISY